MSAASAASFNATSAAATRGSRSSISIIQPMTSSSTAFSWPSTVAISCCIASYSRLVVTVISWSRYFFSRVCSAPTSPSPLRRLA